MSETNWTQVSVDRMWQIVTRDLPAHYDHADGFQKAGELAYLHRTRIRAYKERLEQIWKPDQSPAAQAFLDKLELLMTATENVGSVSYDNHQPSRDIPIAISNAKWKLEPIYNEYKSLETQYRQLSSHPSAAQELYGKMTTKKAQANGIMSDLSTTLVQSQFAVAEPGEYVPPRPRTWRDDGGGNLNAPVIPPVTPMPLPPSAPPPMPPPPSSMSPMPAPTGPDLSGMQPAPASQQIGLPASPGTATTAPQAPATGGPLPPGGVIGGRPGTGPLPGARPTAPGGLGTMPVRGGAPAGGVIGGAANTARGASGVRANPPGGMIGGTGARGGAAGAAPRGVAGGVTGAAPRGGVGGAAATGGRPGAVAPGARGTGSGGRMVAGGAAAGTAGAGRGGPAGAMGAAGRGNRQDQHDDDFDPDTMWDVNQGVTPVLDAPDAPSPVDPGPAIGRAR